MNKELESITKQSLSLEKQLQPFFERNTELMKQLSALTQSISDITKTIGPLLKSIEEPSKLWSKSFRDISDLIESLSPKYITKEQYAIFVHNAKQYGRRGWGIHPYFPHDIIIQDSKKVDSILEECKNSAIDNTNTCLDAIKEEIGKEFRDVIEEAIICFNSNCYRACCCLLLSQIDRIFQSFSMEQFSMKMIYKQDKRDKIDQTVTETYDVSKHDISKMLIWVSLKEALDILYRSVQFEDYTEEFDTENINRHTIQHGYSQHTFEAVDCLQLSTILYSLIAMVEGWEFINTRSFTMMGTLVEEE
ncbi:MAG: hypothetical protein E7Z69_00885 [Thermoplasmata archaeon]|nr:hypothetical protein [Thermoplasmata archaeon]